MIARLVSDPAIVAASVRSTGSGNTSRVISRALATTRSVGHQITGSRDSTVRDVIAIAEVRRAQVRTTSSFTSRLRARRALTTGRRRSRQLLIVVQ